jgi:exonuclease SbcD
MSFTIVHCADVHLETVFADVRGGAARRALLADAFARIVDEAIAAKADAMTIGGDLYESARAGPQTARFLFEHFARFGKPIFIAPGNHDPYSAGSLYARSDLPENVRVFTEVAWQPVPLAEGITLFGFGHTPAEPGRPFQRARFDRDGVQIALVHGSDEDRCPPGKRATAPFVQREIVASGATLALTGHYHGGYIARSGGAPVFGYPGSPEPIKFGERGAHGALVLRVDDANVTLESHEIAQSRLLDAACDLSGSEHESATMTRVAKALEGCGPLDFVRLRLTGVVARGTRVDQALLEERMGRGLGALSIVDETASFDYERVALEPTVRGHVVRDLLELARDDDPANADLARASLRYALAAFEGADIAP